MSKVIKHRGVIFDNLLGRERFTKPCMSESDAVNEANEKIKRLCNMYNVSETDGRFVLDCVEWGVYDK